MSSLSARIDAWMAAGPVNRYRQTDALAAQMRWVHTSAGVVRVVCFDMPGFGFSAPGSSFDHLLDQGAAAIIELFDQLKVPQATLAMSCANGFYALRVAQLAPHRVTRLVLSQTPSMQAMRRWTDRVVPKVLKLPPMGQVAGRLFRQKIASSWYLMALPKSTDATPFQREASSAFVKK